MQGDPVVVHDPSNGRDCLNEGTLQGNERTNYKNDSSAAFQNDDPESAGRLPSPAATADSISIPQGRIHQATGLAVDARPESCGADGPQDCQGLGPGHSQSSEHPTALAPAGGTPRGDQTKIVATPPNLQMSMSQSDDCSRDRSEVVPNSLYLREPMTQGLRVNDHECDGSEPQNLSTVANSGGGTTKVGALMVRRPADHVQHASQHEQRQQLDLPAVQSTCEMSNGDPRDCALVSAPVAGPSTPASDLHMGSAHAAQAPSTMKRAYRRRNKTGCITCGRRRKKCDEQQPSCM